MKTPSAYWDGDKLIGTLLLDGKQITATVDRETIHRHAAGFNDALTWEIERHAEEIFGKLKPYLLAKHGHIGAGTTTKVAS